MPFSGREPMFSDLRHFIVDDDAVVDRANNFVGERKLPLIGEMLGVERAAIEVQDDGVRHSVRIGDLIDFEIEDIVPFGVETGEPVRFAGMFHPVASDLTIASPRENSQ